MPSSPPEALARALADHYRLEREIGAGGMATVYLAQDLKHHRSVAVKVLRPELAATMGAERFLREVTIAANLQHPHILPLYDSGEAAGFLYYVMPYVEGQTLRDRLVRERELPIGDAVRILRDVTDAMSSAHAKGVVHRDLKPENIMLSGRHALVADFGVAKAVSEATGRNKLTTAGVALGTPAYMAPEQATADPHTDHRADLYALGVIAYEMLTGDPPFVRGTPQALLAAHVTEAPIAVTERRTSIPAPLGAMVMRCLEKKPADRPQGAEELLAVLESLATSSGGITPTDTRPLPAVTSAAPASRRWVRPAAMPVGVALLAVLGWAGRGLFAPKPDLFKRTPIVVLPFEVRSADPALKSLGIDAAERIAGAIQQASIGEVVPHRSNDPAAVFTEKWGRSVARETDAGTLIVGTISQRGTDVEIEARVVRAADLKTIWTLGPTHSGAANAGAAVDSITQRVLGATGWYLGPGNERTPNPGIYRPPTNLAAVRLALKADELFRTGNQRKSLPLWQQAFALDTTWLTAPSTMWSIYFNAGDWRHRDSVFAFLETRRARLTLGEARSLDVKVARLASPEAEFRAATAFYAADSAETYAAMWSSVRARRPKDALRFYALRDTATAWSRDWQPWFTFAASAHHMLGEFDKELALARAAKAREPRSLGHWLREVRALAALKRFDEVDRRITESRALENPTAAVQVTNASMDEASDHGMNEHAQRYARQSLSGMEPWSDSLKKTILFQNSTRSALRVLGDFKAVVSSYESEAKRQGVVGLGHRVLGMRDRIRMGDTSGALALVDSARTQPLEAFSGSSWALKGAPLYYGAHILALLGRKDEAVATLRDALNNGWRLGPDEPLQWYWAPIKDYPPFVELVKLR
jgi:tRNA A-37 threonylcarbamoyl transferase component Bud32/TolB-like protein/tetratricopeptide (TPR) repeat protein